MLTKICLNCHTIIEQDPFALHSDTIYCTGQKEKPHERSTMLVMNPSPDGGMADTADLKSAP